MIAQGRRALRISGIPSTALFFALAYVISWGAWIPLAMLGETVTPGDAWPSHVPGLTGPMLTTWLTEDPTGQPSIIGPA